MNLALDFKVPSQAEIMTAFVSHYDKYAKAGKETMKKAAEIAKQKGRASIRAGGPGFQGRWPNALRADVYPKNRDSANAAALIYIRSTYAGIFEDGGTVRPIRGKLLWLPLKDAPLRSMGRKKMTPERYIKEIGPLTFVHRPGKMPLLVAFVRGSAKSLAGPASRAHLKRGLGGKGKETRMVPIFVGVKRVTVPKKWNIRMAAAEAVVQIPQIFVNQLRRERGR